MTNHRQSPIANLRSTPRTKASSPQAEPIRLALGALIAADLHAATGRSGWRATLGATLYEPGFATVLFHRLAVALQQTGWERLAKLLWRVNVAASSCHLHLDAIIGPGFKLPHPTGVVVGAGTRIGSNVTLYQHVTLGRARREEIYPLIDDDVIIFPNAVIAGAMHVGKGGVVGACAVVTDDVPDHGVVAGNPARLLYVDTEPVGRCVP